MSHHLPYESNGRLAFGVYSSLPKLPQGYDWIMRHNDWLYVRDEHSRFYYVDFPSSLGILLVRRRKAGLWDWIRTAGRLRVGDYYKDDRYTIFIPPPKKP